MIVQKEEENENNQDDDDDGTKAIIESTEPRNRQAQAQYASSTSSSPSSSSSFRAWLLLLSFFGLGSSSWILVNAIYAQIPLIVVGFEYDYTIVSKMTLCITTTSLIPILWTTTIVPLLESNQPQQNQQRQQRENGASNNYNTASTKFYWTTTVGIALNLTIGLGVALGVAFSPTATTQLSSLLTVSFCSGIVGTMSLVLYFPHAASTSMISGCSTSPSSSSPAGVVSNFDTDAVVERHDNKAQERNAKNDNKKSEDDNADAATTANAALQQTTAMASGTAVANLFVGVLAIIQFNVVPRNKQDDGVLFSLQGYFGVVAGIFVLAVAGFIGTLVIPARVRQRTLASSVTKMQTNGTTSSVGIEMEHIHGTNEISVKSQQSSTNDSAGNCSDTFGSNEPLVRPSNKRQPKNHGSISDPVSSSSPQKQQQQIQKVQKPVNLLTHLSIDDDDEADDYIEEQQQQYISATTNRPKSSSSSFSLFVRMSKKHWTLNSAQCVLNVLTFFLPGVVPFSVQHYQDPQRALHFLTVTQLLGQTLGIVFSGYYQNTSVVAQLILFVLLWIPTVTLSIVNNTDFQSIQQHSAVPITINALLQFLYGYSSTTFFHLVNREASASQASSNDDSAEIVRDGRGLVPESPIELDHKQQQDDPNPDEINDGEVYDDDDDDDGDDPHIASRILGTYNQIGAMMGSLVAYFLVEYKVIS